MITVKEFISELQLEAGTTRKVLERIPQTDLKWKPHEKSMAIGRLAMHVAELPGWILRCIESDEFDFASMKYNPIIPDTRDQVMQVFESTLQKAIDLLTATTDNTLSGNWTLRRGGTVILQTSKRLFIRYVMNHLMHHRGQLSVYLRLLNIPVPSMYGPSADEKA